MSKAAKTHEPLFHITKRADMPFMKAMLIRIAAIACAFVTCAFVIVFLTDLNPIEVYSAMFKGAFGSTRKIWLTAQGTAVLLCISLAVTPAFKMRFWNIGAEGQVLIGCLATAACMILIGDRLPTPLLFIVMLLASILAGAFWAVIPAAFKAKWNTNETLFTLMMNYVAIQVVSFFITKWENPKGSATIGVVNPSTQVGWLPSLFGNKYILNILIVLTLTIATYIYLKYSKHGYEIAVVGQSENTARYVGMNVKKVIVRTMAISGALCGIAGFIIVSGIDHTLSTDSAGGQGFTAIMVSWLAKFNPLVMIATSFMLIFFDRGASQIAQNFRLNESISDILTGIILFFIIGCEFLVNYKINFRSSKKEGC